MTSLFTALPHDADTAALIIPSPQFSATLSHGDLSRLSLKFQQKLANTGISPRHTVALALPNSVEFAVVFLATTFQRASSAPLNPAYTQDEFEFCLQSSNVPLILLPKGAVAENGEAVRAATRCGTAMGEVYYDGSEVNLAIMDFGKTKKRVGVEVETPSESDVAVILHTRESTGQLEAIPLTHQVICSTITQEIATYNLAPTDRCLAIMPLYHIHGLLACFLAPLCASSSLILPSRFSAQDFWSNFTTYSATWYTAIPPIHQAILRSLPNKLPKIRFVRSCSSSLQPNVLKRMELVLNAPILEGNAMSDLSHDAASAPTTSPISPTQKPGCVGKAQGLEMQILDSNDRPLPRGQTGQVCVLGASIVPGYTAISNLPGVTKSGYFKTGDTGYIDEEGYLFLVSTNKKRMSVVANEKTSEKVWDIEMEFGVLHIPKLYCIII
ncbi:acetyl-CoA synthetase-like protein [Mollisia scopiformis]|uniref:Acetyl-CoA synthetase-like protein n=1 Tax=Mollisia scopiformis TaxID=149040 RepID=A0A132B5Y0_MOLSC|nr:acetyl-CoA synthetase-like protein [Mollisia scopiformis]KUJ07294.1 acetyl-CoA synthetase-like protein [Mollisia scopiformis]